MTLCQVTFKLQASTLSERQLSAMEKLKSQLLGMRGFRFPDAADQLIVSYDASRLTVPEVESALKQAGIPVCRN